MKYTFVLVVSLSVNRLPFVKRITSLQSLPTCEKNTNRKNLLYVVQVCHRVLVKNFGGKLTTIERSGIGRCMFFIFRRGKEDINPMPGNPTHLYICCREPSSSLTLCSASKVASPETGMARYAGSADERIDLKKSTCCQCIRFLMVQPLSNQGRNGVALRGSTASLPPSTLHGRGTG